MLVSLIGPSLFLCESSEVCLWEIHDSAELLAERFLVTLVAVCLRCLFLDLEENPAVFRERPAQSNAVLSSAPGASSHTEQQQFGDLQCQQKSERLSSTKASHLVNDGKLNLASLFVVAESAAGEALGGGRGGGAGGDGRARSRGAAARARPERRRGGVAARHRAEHRGRGAARVPQGHRHQALPHHVNRARGGQ